MSRSVYRTVLPRANDFLLGGNELIDQVINRAGHQSVNPEAVTKLDADVIVKKFCHLSA